MAETFCGKSCENCEEKQAMHCGGCKKSWGKPANEDCEIAVCCYGKGHEACETCAFLNNCGKVRGREDMAYYRRRRREEDERRKGEWRQTRMERAALMGKWCTVLFWTMIVAELVGLLSLLGESILTESLSVICGVAYGAALLQLAPLTQRYRTAGICAIAAAVVVLITGIIPANEDGAVLALLVTLPGGIVALVGDYHEFHAHAEMLSGMDDEFAKKWEMLWKWNIRLLLSAPVSALLVIISPVLFALAGFAIVIGLVVIEVTKIFYIHRMSKFFRNYEPL